MATGPTSPIPSWSVPRPRHARANFTRSAWVLSRRVRRCLAPASPPSRSPIRISNPCSLPAMASIFITTMADWSVGVRSTLAPSHQSASCRLLERRQRGLVIGLLDDLGNDLGVGDLVRGINHEHRTGQERDGQALDQDAVILAKAVVVRIGKV